MGVIPCERFSLVRRSGFRAALDRNDYLIGFRRTCAELVGVFDIYYDFDRGQDLQTAVLERYDARGLMAEKPWLTD